MTEVSYLERAGLIGYKLDDSDLTRWLQCHISHKRPDTDLVQMLSVEGLHEQSYPHPLLPVSYTHLTLPTILRV